MFFVQVSVSSPSWSVFICDFFVVLSTREPPHWRVPAYHLKHLHGSQHDTKPPALCRLLLTKVTTKRSDSRVIRQPHGDSISVEEHGPDAWSSTVTEAPATASVRVRHGYWGIAQLHGSP